MAVNHVAFHIVHPDELMLCDSAAKSNSFLIFCLFNKLKSLKQNHGLL